MVQDKEIKFYMEIENQNDVIESKLWCSQHILIRRHIKLACFFFTNLKFVVGSCINFLYELPAKTFCGSKINCSCQLIWQQYVEIRAHSKIT